MGLGARGMRAYKHLRSSDLRFYRDASFRLTTLHEMAQREDLGGLHDPMEGQVAMSLGDGPLRRIEAGQDEVLDQFFGIAPGAKVFMGGDARFVLRAENYWIWCVTCAEDADVGGPDYDTVLEVVDLDRLAWQICYAANGTLGPPIIREVRYAPRERLFGENGPRESPFIKGLRFKPEKETRVAWPMVIPVQVKELNVVAPEAAKLLRLNGTPLARTA